MNLLIIIGIIYSFFYVLSIGGLVLLFFRKDIKFAKQWNLNRSQLVKAVFIMPNMTLKTEYKLYDENNMIEFEKGKYNVDKKSAVFTGRTDTSWSQNILTMFYEYGNPNPINYHRVKKDETIAYTDAEAFKIAMEQKFIKDLMTEVKKMLIIMLMIAGVGILVVINLWFTYGIKKTLTPGG